MSGATDTFDRRDTVDMAAAAIMVGLTFSWGLNYVAAKISYAGYDPVFLSIARSIIGGLCVFALVPLARHRAVHRAMGRCWPALPSACCSASSSSVLYVGLEHTTVARNTLLVNTMPFWVLIGGAFPARRADHRCASSLGLLLAFAGLVAVFSDKLSRRRRTCVRRSAEPRRRIFLGVDQHRHQAVEAGRGERREAAALSARRCGNRWRCWCCLSPVRSFRDPAVLPTLALLFQAVYIVAFTYVLWFWLLRRYPASGLSSFTFLSPVFGVLCGAVLLE